MKKLGGWCLCVLILSGCATRLDGLNYQATEPRFDLFGFFDGSVTAWGLVQGRDGELIQRFQVEIEGRIEGDVLTLDEQFTYGFGEGVTDRVWTIERLGEGRYQGQAGDVNGVADGQSHGNAFHWTYRMTIPVKGQSLEVRFEDWFWALDKNRIMNRSYLQKFGFDVAEVTIFMERHPTQ
jgi:hypothetical protein